jgi:hypothetical protein
MLTEDVRLAMEGVHPAHIVTCSAAGIPNVAILSEVWYIDEYHVALSNQYFNKTKANLADNPHAMVRVTNADIQVFELRIRYLRTETSGAIFDQMALKLDAIATFMGMTEVFKLKGADIYEVIQVQECMGFFGEEKG